MICANGVCETIRYYNIKCNIPRYYNAYRYYYNIPSTVVRLLSVRRKPQKSRNERNGLQGHHRAIRLIFYVMPRGLLRAVIQSYIVIASYCIVL